MQDFAKLSESFLKLLPIDTEWQIAHVAGEGSFAAALTALVVTFLYSQALRLVDAFFVAQSLAASSARAITTATVLSIVFATSISTPAAIVATSISSPSIRGTSASSAKVIALLSTIVVKALVVAHEGWQHVQLSVL